MVVITPKNLIPEFQKLGIPIFTPGHREFELSVATPNFLYRYHRPEWVVHPRNGEDVATTVRAANDLGKPITVKNGGHSYAGFSNADSGILVDMSSMKAVTIDDVGSGKVLTCSAGALWGGVYNELATNSNGFDGWIANGGRCPAVGVTGFILGGGFGPFSRSLGVGSDQLLEVEIVTVNGEVVTLREDTDEEGKPKSKEGRLFWALTGCGGGNFGIVTKLKIKIMKLVDKWVVAGRLVWTVERDLRHGLQLEHFTGLMSEFYRANWDNNMTLDSTWSCDLTRATKDRPFATRFISYYDGRKGVEPGVTKCFDQEIDDKLVSTGGQPEPLIYEQIRTQIKRRVIQEPSTLFLYETLWSQWSEETRRSLPTQKAYTLYSSWVIQNDQATIEGMMEIIPARMERFREKFGGSGDSGIFEVTWIHVGGEISKVPPTETAYPWRAGNYCVYIMVRWNEKWLTNEMETFFKECKDMIKVHSMEGKASYVNFSDRQLEGWAEAYYGPNLKELQEVHKIWVEDRVSILGHNALDFPQGIGKSNTGGPRLPQPRARGAGRARGFRGYNPPLMEEESKAEEVEDDQSEESQETFDPWEDLWKHWGHFVPQRKDFEYFATGESQQLPRC